MSKQTEPPTDAGGCGPSAPSRRNRYYRDKRLHVADYVLEQQYHIARRRLVNRAMLGWGVVQGFVIDREGLSVGPGVALDPQGRELVACATVKLGRGDLLWLGTGKHDCGCGLAVVEPPEEPAEPTDRCDDRDDPCAGLYLLSAHYAEKRIDNVRIDDDCGGARCEANQLCETVVYSLRPVDCCPSGLPDCRCPACAGEDTCGCDRPAPEGYDTPPPPPPEKDQGKEAIPDQAEAAPADRPASAEYPHGSPHDPTKDAPCFTLDRGNHRQLVRWSEDGFDGFDPCQTGGLSEHGCFAFDPCAGVPLACVKLEWDCGEPRVASVVDDAHPRRLARSNETLFDLVRGCDLTRIMDVSWRDWLPGGTRVPLSDFKRMFDAPVDTPADAPERQDNRRRRTGTVTTRFKVSFSGPVQANTLTPDVVVMALIQREPREGVGAITRVPIVALSPLAQLSTDPVGTTRGFSVEIDRAFYAGEIDSYDASGFEERTVIEIEIRTDWILDCNGQEVAGGGRGVPSTGSVPGGRHLSSFAVLPDDQWKAASPSAAEKPVETSNQKEA